MLLSCNIPQNPILITIRPLHSNLDILSPQPHPSISPAPFLQASASCNRLWPSLPETLGEPAPPQVPFKRARMVLNSGY